jgi:hypothetical protein
MLLFIVTFSSPKPLLYSCPAVSLSICVQLHYPPSVTSLVFKIAITQNAVFSLIRMTDLLATVYTENLVRPVKNTIFLSYTLYGIVTCCSKTSVYIAVAIFSVDVRRKE